MAGPAQQEHDNLRTVLIGCQAEDGDTAIGLRLAAALGPFWEVRGYHTEGRSWLTSVLKHSGVQPQQDGNVCARPASTHRCFHRSIGGVCAPRSSTR